MKTKHRRAVARTIALVAALTFIFTLPAFAGYVNGSMGSLGSYSCSTSTSSASTSVSPVGQFIYASASISTTYHFLNPNNPLEPPLIGSANSSQPPRKGYTATCSTSASAARYNAGIPSNWYVYYAKSTHSGSVNDEYGNHVSMNESTEYR